MNDTFFVDTNLLVYCRDNALPDKNVRAKKWLDFLWKSQKGRLSIQVLTEYYEVVRRKNLSHDMKLVEADIGNFYTWDPQGLTTADLTAAFDIRTRFKLSWWDALIIASAQRIKCSYLLSEDLQNMQNIDQLKIVNPFEFGPEKLI